LQNKIKWAKVGLIGFALMMQLKPGDIGATELELLFLHK
jgi:hypothetical protein